MPKLKTPRAAEPNKPGCLKYGATVFCIFGAISYIFLFFYAPIIDSSTDNAQYVFIGMTALMVLFIWLMWRKPKAKRTPASSSFSPLEGKVIDVHGLRVQYQNGRAYDYSTGKPLSKKQLQYLRQCMQLNSNRDDRVISDCLELTRKTLKPDVFFMRDDLLVRTLTEVTLYHKLFRVPRQDPEEDLRRAIDTRDARTCDFVQRSHSDMAQKAAVLKTEKARAGRYEKYYQAMEPFQDQLTEQARALLKKYRQQDTSCTAPVEPTEAIVPKPESGAEAFSELPFTIPPDVLSLLWIKNGPLCNCTSAQEKEPSAIDLTLPLDLSPSAEDLTADIGYYPSYERLTPKQRTVYLRWLSDISKSVPVGYVFIFYYGLERFLFTEKYEAALDMINRLRLFHSNNSLLGYSADAMLVGCLLHNRPDLIGMIDTSKTSTELYLYIKGYLAGGLSASDLMNTGRRWNFTNTRYIKGQPALFEQQLSEVLTEQYGSSILPLSHDRYVQAERTFTIALANTSLPQDARFAAAKDITSNTEVAQTVLSLLQTAHDRVKHILAEERKNK